MSAILTLHELREAQQRWHGASVRVVATCVVISHGFAYSRSIREFNASKSEVVVSEGSETLAVRISDLPMQMAFTPGSLFTFIGLFDAHGGRPVIQARVGRCVDGLDVKLFAQALALRRQMLPDTP